MEPIKILMPIISSFWWIIPFLIIVAIFKTSWFKGKIGEYIVKILLQIFLAKDKYNLIHNVTLLTEDGTTQIDHIVVSQYGVFVIETKI